MVKPSRRVVGFVEELASSNNRVVGKFCSILKKKETG